MDKQIARTLSSAPSSSSRIKNGRRLFWKRDNPGVSSSRPSLNVLSNGDGKKDNQELFCKICRRCGLSRAPMWMWFVEWICWTCFGKLFPKTDFKYVLPAGLVKAWQQFNWFELIWLDYLKTCFFALLLPRTLLFHNWTDKGAHGHPNTQHMSGFKRRRPDTSRKCRRHFVSSGTSHRHRQGKHFHSVF